MLKNRIVTAIWAIPVLSLIIWFGEPYFTIAAAVVGLLAAIEFFRLTKRELINGWPSVSIRACSSPRLLLPAWLSR
jgi:CDP-diglyceride synthetase